MPKCEAVNRGAWTGKITTCVLRANHDNEHKDSTGFIWINYDKYCGEQIPAQMGAFYCKKPPGHSGYHRVKLTQNPCTIEFKVIK